MTHEENERGAEEALTAEELIADAGAKWVLNWLEPRIGLLTVFSSGPQDEVTYWFGEDPEAHSTLYKAVEAYKAYEEMKPTPEPARDKE